MSKFFTSLLFWGLMAFSISAQAQPTLSFDPASTTVNNGDQFCVDVTIDNFDNILGAQFSINYDSLHLQYVSVGNFGLTGLNQNVMGLPINGGIPKGNITVSWFDNSLQGVTLPDGTVLFELCFEAIGNDVETDLVFSGTPTAIQFIDGNNNIVAEVTNDGSVTIGNPNGGGGNDDFILSLSDASGSQGDQVCLDATVDGFTDILGLQFSLDYDPSKLLYVSVGNFGLAGLNQNVMGLPGAGGTNPGDITVSWFDNSLNGVTVPDGTVLFEVCFEILASSGTATVDYSDTPTDIQVIDSDNNILPYDVNSGIVTINGGGGGTGDFILNMSNASGSQGDQVCVDASVEGFTDILGLQFSIDYDPAKLQFVSVGNFGLPGLNENIMGLPGPGGTNPGDITVSWFDNSLNGVTVADGTVLFEVCFEILASTGTAAVDYSDDPTDIQVIDVDNNILPFEVNNGVITINGGGGGTGDFILNMSNASGSQGDQVCVDASVEGFTDILGLQFSIDYDPAKLQFVSVGNFGLPGLNENIMGLPGPGGTNPGDITVSWFDNSLNGVTVADGTVLFEVCFEILASTGTAAVDYSDDPTDIQVIDVDNNILPFEINNGVITINGGGGGTGDFTLNLSDAMGQQNDLVCLDATVENFNDILGLQFSLDYDPAKLQYVSVGNFGLPGLNENIMGLPGPGGTNPGDITVSWFDNSLNGVSVANGTVLFEVCFTILFNTGSTPVTYSEDPTDIQVIDSDNNILAYEINNGTVSIGTVSSGDDFMLNASDETVTGIGTQACVEITTDNFTDILGMQFSLDYDPGKLEYVSVGNFGLTGLNENVMGLPIMGGTSPGDITVSWFDNSLNGVTLADGTVLFEVCFNTLQLGTAQVAFSDNPTDIQVIDSDNTILAYQTNDGSVTAEVDDTPMFDDFALLLSDENIMTGEEVCLEVTTQNFDNILGVQFSIDYDPTDLEFVSVGNFGLAGLNENVMGLPGAGGTNPGDITVSWFDNSLNGVTVPDNTVLFEVCFNALLTSGSTPVSFTDDPTLIQVIDGNNTILPYDLKQGSVTIGDDPPPAGFEWYISDVEICPDEPEFCVDITVTGFEDVLGAQFSISYDPGEMTFNSVSNFGLPDLTVNQFGVPGDGTNPGQITFIWFDNALQGQSVADGTVIFTLCFEPTGNDGTSTVIDFSGTPTPIQILDPNSNELPFVGNEGTVTYSCAPTDPPMISSTVTDVDCKDESTGAIDVSVTGGSGDYSYSWDYQGSTSQDLSNLPAGDYSITVTDDVTLLTSTSTITVDEPASAIIITLTQVTDVSCNGESDGVIGLVAGGGTGTLTYSWNNGLPSVPNPSNLSAGTDYQVTISDENGCELVSGLIEVTEPAALTLTGQSENISCNGEETGTISLNLSGGTPTYSVAWSDGMAADMTSRNMLAGGTYGVTVSDVNDCEVVESFEIIEPDVLEVTPTVEDVTCMGATTGSIDLAISGGTGDYTIDWGSGLTDGQTTQDELGAGTYMVSVSDANGCEVVSSIDITEPDTGIEITGTTENVECNGAPTGSIAIEVNGGTPDYTINWSDGLPSGLTQDQLEAGSYTVSVTDANGCMSNETFIINSDAPIFITSTIQNVTCNGDANGSVSITIAGGTSDFTINWGGSLQDDVTVQQNLAGGTYSVTVEDNNSSCIKIESFQVIEPGPLAISGDVTNVACNGESTGSIDLAINGGTPDYTIDWDGLTDGETTQTALAAGMYSATITDANNCSISPTFMVTQPSLLTVNTVVDSIDCFNDANGQISVTVSGGSPSYTLDWGAPLNDGFMTQSNLDAGTYQLTVTDNNDCVQELSFVLDEPQELVIDAIVPTDVFLGNDGQVAIDVSGGSLPYEYRWDGPSASNISQQEDLSALDDLGEYCVTVTDNKGCTAVACTSIKLRLQFGDVTIIENCPGSQSGSVSVEVLGGVPGYTYTWDPAAPDTNELTSLAEGTYSLTVTDSEGETISGEFTLGTYPAMTVTATVTPAEGLINNINGGIDLTISGGLPPYDIVWDSNLTGEPLENISAGEYCVTITDQNGCTYEECYTVEFIPLPIEITALTSEDALCPGDNSGSISLSVYGGVPVYTLTIPGLGSFTSVSGNFLVSNVAPGTYAYTIVDGDGQTLNGNVEVAGPDPIIITSVDVVHDSEGPTGTGSIQIMVQGGTPPYSYSWNAAGASGSTIINLPAGTYLPTITDSRGCVAAFPGIDVTEFVVTASSTANNCPMDTEGAIDLNIAGGDEPYTYSWSGPGGFTSTDEDITGLLPGAYNVTVTEASGNTSVKVFFVSVLSNLTLGVNITSDYNNFAVSCADASDGTAVANAILNDANCTDCNYEWEVNGELVSVDATLQNAIAGTYTLTVVDPFGCTVQRNVVMNAPSPIVIDGSVSDVSCPGEDDGELVVLASGGVSNQFFYNWSDNSIGFRNANLTAGSYTVTATDINNCEGIATFDVFEPDPINITLQIEPATELEPCNGSVWVVVEGGNAPYSYDWMNAEVTGNPSLVEGLCPGDYFIRVTDSNNCAVSQETVIAEVENKAFPCFSERVVITPDGNGTNDEFIIFCIGDFPDNHLEIYNRWGQLVYEADNYDNTWEGTTEGGDPLPEGAYYYVLEYTDNSTGEEVQQRGSISLLRE